MILGYLLALLGALGSGTGSVLESIGVRRSGAFGGDSDDLGKVAKQPVYWMGVTIDILSFAAAAAALHRLPLFLVQSVMAFSVGVTAVISRFLGVRLGRFAWWALGVAVMGLVLLGLSAHPGPGRVLAPGWRWAMVGLAAAVILIGIFGSRTNYRWTAALLGFGAGLGFSAVAVSARTLHLPDHIDAWLTEPGVLAIVGNGVGATAVFVLALQKGNATTVSAIMFTTNTVLPSTIGLVLLGDTIRPHWALPAAFGFVMTVSGAIALAHFSEQAERHRRRQECTEDREPVPAGD